MKQAGFRTLVAIACAVLTLQGCGGGGGRAVPATAPVHLPTAKSVSPASVAAPPMARTAIQPSSTMTGIRVPKSSIAPVSWTQIPGGAIYAAASPDGSLWVLSSVGSGADRAIWHYANGAWTNIPGAAMRLATAPDNTLWAVNSAGGIYHYANGNWTTIAGGASDISVAADGSVYAISNQGGGPYGFGIWHFANGSWTQLPGAGVRIAASWDGGTYGNVAPGGFWVTNAAQSIYYYNPSSGFSQVPGAAAALAPTTIGGLFVLGVPNSPNGNPVYYFDLSSGNWESEPGAAISIATDSAHVYAIGANGGIYETPVTLGTPTPAPSPGPTTTPVATDCTYGASRARIAGLSGRRLASHARGGVVPGKLYVKYAPAAGATAIASVERSTSAVHSAAIGRIGSSPLRVVTLPAGANTDAAAAALRKNANVQGVYPVHYRSLLGDPAHGANDQYFDNVDQWYLYKTNVVKNGGAGAWDLSVGASSISVAMIDTGVDLTGPSLGGHDFIVDHAEKVLNGNVTVGNAAAQDTNGHGTNTAGLAVAQANDAYGFAGVGYSTHLQAYDIFPDATASSDQQEAYTSDEAIAIDDAVANGASVISMSLGSGASSGVDAGEEAAVENAIAHGVVVVAANGNECGDGSGDGNQPDYPAGYPGVIAVGASAVGTHTANNYASIASETIASYSNSGPTLVAPGGDAGSDLSGSDILLWIEGYGTTTAPYPDDQCSNTGGVCRILFNGTSQATPQVAGTVALMEAYHGGPRSLTPAQAASILTSTADVLPGVVTDRQGAGRLNAGRAVAAAHP